MAQELLLNAQQEVFEVGEVIEVKVRLGLEFQWRGGCVWVRCCSAAKKASEISGDNKNLLKFFEAQPLEVNVGVA